MSTIVMPSVPPLPVDPGINKRRALDALEGLVFYGILLAGVLIPIGGGIIGLLRAA